jgi:penicillin amidase
LRRTDKHSVETMIAMQADNFSADTADVLPLLLAVPPRDERARQALGLLQSWDRRMRADRPEPLIYDAWLRELHRGLFADELGEELFSIMLNPTVADLIMALRDHPAWCDDVATAQVESCQDVIARSLSRALSQLSAAYGSDMEGWRWGRAHVAQHRHFLFDRVPLLRNLASVHFAADGGMHTLNRATPGLADPAAPYAFSHGATYRAIYDLADLDHSLFAIPLGQSGNFLSPWYIDAIDEWRTFRYRQIAGPRYLVERGGIGTLSLRRP